MVNSVCVYTILYIKQCFDDEDQILLGIKDEDTEMLQNDLHELYIWANTNKMKFNKSKFELRRYGKKRQIITATICKSYDDSNIDSKVHVEDLRKVMSNTDTFTLHIRNIF